MRLPPAPGDSRLSAVLLALALVACAGVPSPLPLVPADQIEGAFLWRQRIWWQAGPSRGVVDAVVRKQGDELLVVLLDPVGVRLLAIRQQGLKVEAEGPAPAAVPSEAVLTDLHRAYFWPPERPHEGETRSQRSEKGWTVFERWDAGGLSERRFQADGAKVPETVVTYGARSKDGFPVELRLANRRLHYVLEVHTLSRVPLPEAAREGSRPERGERP